MAQAIGLAGCCDEEGSDSDVRGSLIQAILSESRPLAA
jgi:hypothetical protein